MRIDLSYITTSTKTMPNSGKISTSKIKYIEIRMNNVYNIYKSN